MNYGFITARISEKHNLSTYNNEKLITKLVLVIPSIEDTLISYNIQAYIYGDIAKKIADLCTLGEYLFLEGSIWTQTITANKTDSTNVHLLIIIHDIQPIF